MINILKFSIDEGGNEGWVLESQVDMTVDEALSYIKELSLENGSEYLAEISTSANATIISEVE